MKKLLEKEDLFKLKERTHLKNTSNYNCQSPTYMYSNLSYMDSGYGSACYKKRWKTINNGWEINSIRDTLDVSSLEKEQANYLKKKDELVAKYNGKYIALVNGEVKDSDDTFSDLAKRVYSKFGYREIFMTLVTKEKSPHKLSPKFV